MPLYKKLWEIVKNGEIMTKLCKDWRMRYPGEIW